MSCVTADRKGQLAVPPRKQFPDSRRPSLFWGISWEFFFAFGSSWVRDFRAPLNMAQIRNRVTGITLAPDYKVQAFSIKGG